MTVVLANPAHIKNIPGRKTEVKDCPPLGRLHGKFSLSTSRIDQATPDCVTHQVGCLMNVQFFHEPGSIGLRGFTLKFSCWATSAVVCPSAISCNICSSRAVSESTFRLEPVRQASAIGFDTPGLK